MAKQINTVEEVILALGGAHDLARRFDVVSHAVLMWRLRDGFPPETFLAMNKMLAERGLKAPPSLWRQKEPVA